MSENNGDYEQLLNENDQFNYFKGNVFPCDSGFGPSVATCDDEQDACVKYSLDFSHYYSKVSANDHYYAVSMTQYRCGKASENTGLGESPHCMELTERIDNKVEDGTSNWAYDICTETVTERRETVGGSEGDGGEESSGGDGSGGESDSKDCRHEMCGGGEAAQLTFVLAAACVMLYGMF